MYRASVVGMLRQLADNIENGRFEIVGLKANLRNEPENRQYRNMFIEVSEQWGIPPGQYEYEVMAEELEKFTRNGNS